MKVGIVITVRIGSSRLPRKALMPINQKPILAYLIERLKYINKDAAQIIICTTTLAEDLVFEELARNLNIDIFKGDPDNILKRHLQCAEHFQLDLIVNVDGDDILCDPEYVNQLINHWHNHLDIDVIKTANLPFGVNSMGYTPNVLRQILEIQINQKIDTGWGELLKDTNRFKIHEIIAADDEQIDARLTLDYQEDFDVFKEIIESLEFHEYIPQGRINAFLDQNPSIKDLNKKMDEIYWSNYESKKKLEGR